MSKAARTEIIPIRLTPDELKEVKQFARVNKCTVSDAMREGRDHLIKKFRRKQREATK